MSLAIKNIFAKIKVFTAPYFKDDKGILRPHRPKSCPYQVSGLKCLIKFNGFRKRKSGTQYPIAICRCKSHKRTFTIYPPGWTPFSRRQNVPLSPNGFNIIFSSSESDQWQNTSFGAAIDAANLKFWPQMTGDIPAWTKKSGVIPYGVAKTQRRHIAGILALFALSPTSNNLQAKVVAELNLDLSILASAAIRVRDGPGIENCGTEGAAVLRSFVLSNRQLHSGIKRLGNVQKFWGPHVEQNS
jgi:hypothetical protein